MIFPCDYCAGTNFKTQSALRSHQTHKKCGTRKTRGISPSNPFLKWFKKRGTSNSYPSIAEPTPELVPSGAKKAIKLKFNRADLKITRDVVPDDADTRSAEYRTKIRAHYDALKDQFTNLTFADYLFKRHIYLFPT